MRNLIAAFATLFLWGSAAHAGLNAAECATKVMDSSYQDSAAIEELVDCYFTLSTTPTYRDRIPSFASAAIVRRLYPDDNAGSNPAVIKAAVLRINGYRMENVSEAEIQDVRMNLLSTLEARYSTLFLGNTKALLNKEHVEAIESSEHVAVGAGTTAFALSYFAQKIGGRKIRGLSNLIALGTTAGAFKLRYDAATKRLYVDGMPPSPSQILGENTRGIEELFDPEVSGNAEYLMKGVLGFAIFPAFAYPSEKIWQAATQHTRMGRAISNKIACSKLILRLQKLKTAMPLTTKVVGGVGNAFLHPVNIAAGYASMAAADASVDKAEELTFARALNNALAALQSAQQSGDKVRIALSEENLDQRMRDYSEHMRRRNLHKFYSLLSRAAEQLDGNNGNGKINEKTYHDLVASEWTPRMKETIKAFAERRQGADNADLFAKYQNSITNKGLSDLVLPSELGLWVAIRAKQMGVTDVSKYTYFADFEAGQLEMYFSGILNGDHDE